MRKNKYIVILALFTGRSIEQGASILIYIKEMSGGL